MISGLSSLEKYPMVNGLYSREEDAPTIEVPAPGSVAVVPESSAATVEKEIIIQRIISFTGLKLMESLSFKSNFFFVKFDHELRFLKRRILFSS